MRDFRKQQGAALLIFILTTVVGASYLLVSKLNANIQLTEQTQATREALASAKAALIGYAVTYPDKVNPDEGPGYLPCPDTHTESNKIGWAKGNCSDDTGTTLGRFPFETLEMPELRDGSGEYLWYALSQNYRYGPYKLIPLNSNIPGTLTVDTIDDVVAILIAPGAPICSQDSRNSSSEQYINPRQYLDGVNADGTLNYTQRGPHLCGGEDQFNDQVVFITRAELMAAVEKRVLGEVAQNLQDYYKTVDYYPWLSPFDNPQTSEFRGEIGTCAGHLPLLGDPASTTPQPDLTEWLINNDWHHLILIAYSKDGRPGAEGDCIASANILEVYRANNDEEPQKAIALAAIAGPPLGEQTRPSATPVSYFEEKNANFEEDADFSAWKHQSGFNDQLRVMLE